MGRFHLISTTAGVQKCQRCRQPCVAGWSEGLLVFCDPVPLSAEGAAAAAEAGTAVYVLARRELVYRDSDHLLLPGLLLPQHTCGQQVPQAWRSAVATLTDASGVIRL